MPKSKITGFTLIELIMVILIIGIIASVTLPKFINLKTQASLKSEDYIAGAMNAAIKAYNMSYIVAGGDPTGYPSVNPFSLLVQAPPFTSTPFGVSLTSDGVTWRYYQTIPSEGAWYIFCPHREIAAWWPPGKGRCWVYQYLDEPYWPPHKAGDFFLQDDGGH